MDSNPMWNAILKWSLAQHDPNRTSEVKEMSQEDKEFLSNAMKSMVVDETQQMRLQIKILELPEEEEQLKSMKESEELKDIFAAKTGDSEEKEMETVQHTVIKKKEGALEYLDDLVQSIDNAIDLHKLGGFAVLINTIDSKHDSISWRALEVLASVVQNNPQCQDWAMELNVLTKLLARLGTHIQIIEPSKDQISIITKSLLALSSMIRNHTKATAAFLEGNGTSLLLQAASAPAASLRNMKKAMFLLLHLLDEEEEGGGSDMGVHSGLCAAKPVKFLVATVGADDVDYRENGLKVFNKLVSKQEGRTMCLTQTENDENVPEILARRLEECKKLVTDPEQRELYEVEIRLIDQVLSKLCPPS